MLALFAVLRFGVPLLIKLAVFVGDMRKNEQVVDETSTSVLIPPALLNLPEATFSAQIDVSGFAQEGTLVTVFLNGNPQDDIVVDDDGEFLLNDLRLRVGKNRIWAISRDGKDNESSESEEMVVVSDNQVPQVTIDSPRDGEEVSEASITVTGLVNEDVDLTVNGQFVLQASDGSFTKNINLSTGENIIVIVAQDAATNESTKEVRVTYSP